MITESGVNSQLKSYQRLKKMLLDSPLLNTQHYKVSIKGKLEKSRELSSALPYTIGVVASEKGAFESLLTKVANFTFFLQLN